MTGDTCKAIRWHKGHGTLLRFGYLVMGYTGKITRYMNYE